jgi:glutamate-ammonia-ligase adenylyltransferase
MTTDFLAARSSPWFLRTLSAHPQWAETIAELILHPLGREPILALLDRLRGPPSYQDEGQLRRVLRELRNQTLAALMERDLSGRADLDEVMDTMTALAEVAIDEALRFLCRDLAASHGVPHGAESGRPEDFMVIGMGKLGGAELNVSSDVDLVFVYGEDGETAGAPPGRGLANQEFFTRLGRRLIGVLSEITAHGFVFRVDMRLRPNGDSGPLVASLAMLEDYFVAQGRNWERYAWIKARLVNGPVWDDQWAARRAQLEAVIAPFVYRRYLDFGAIQALRALHDQIRAEVARRDARQREPTENVKLGRGGIREIEFIAQHFQLIRGGRDPELRGRATQATLVELQARGLVEAPIAWHLISAYRLLREVEHRLQYLEDAQTHSLPADAENRERLARMCQSFSEGGFEALRARLAAEQAFVAHEFDRVFAAPGEPAPLVSERPDLWRGGPDTGLGDNERLEGLLRLGFGDPQQVATRLKALWESPKIRSLSEANRLRLDSLIPHALALAHERATPACDTVVLLGRLLDLLEAIATRAAYLALLSEFPRAFERLAVVLAASPWAARYLTQHPLLLDELLDTRALKRSDFAVVAERLEAAMARECQDVERQMDLLRETHHAETFNLLIQDLEGRLSVEELSDDLSALADLILEATLKACWPLVGGGPGPAQGFAIIAYGKLGGKELGYASDLDLVFLCSDDASEEGSGLRFARLAQRLMTWLTSRTTAGGLFDVDLRLRPDGVAGLLVSTMQGFKHYQERNAWVWEHQALTRARHCAGDLLLGAVFEAERRSILALTRDLATLRSDIVGMRAKMHAAHPNPSGLFDLKHDPGGMVDIEFCVQYLVLGYGHRESELLLNLGNIALLGRAARADLIDQHLASEVARAYRAYRRSQHTLRLAEAPFARVAADALREERRAVFALCSALGLAFGSLEGAARR